MPEEPTDQMPAYLLRFQEAIHKDLDATKETIHRDLEGMKGEVGLVKGKLEGAQGEIKQGFESFNSRFTILEDSNDRTQAALAENQKALRDRCNDCPGVRASTQNAAEIQRVETKSTVDVQRVETKIDKHAADDLDSKRWSRTQTVSVAAIVISGIVATATILFKLLHF